MNTRRLGRGTVAHRTLLWALVLLVGVSLPLGCDVETPEEKARREYEQSFNHLGPPQFSVVTRGQGVPGSAPYTPGAAVTVFPIYFNSAANDWFYGVLFADKVEDLIPAGMLPTSSSAVQLVLVTESHSVKSPVQYTNGGAFFHWTCRAELREAATGRLVAVKSFAGDNRAPSVISGPVVPTASDKLTMVPAVQAWIAQYF